MISSVSIEKCFTSAFHEGFANSNYRAIQVKAMKSKYRCTCDALSWAWSKYIILSTVDFNYNLMALDAIALQSHLHIHKTHIVGWYDSAIVVLDMAMKYPNRVRPLFVFAANCVSSGVKDLTKIIVLMSCLNR